MTHLTNVLVTANLAEISITTYNSPSTCVKNINHIRHVICNICGKLPISVEFRSKPNKTRVAVLKCNVKKVVIFITGFIAIYFRDKLMWIPFSHFTFLCSHFQLNCLYFSRSLYPLLISARKIYKLQSVLLTFSTWRVLRWILDESERNHNLVLEETNINWNFSIINLHKCH
jgi:hypothetical protein